MSEQHPFVQIEEALKKEFIEKACKYLNENLQDFIYDDWASLPDFIKEFKKAMEE